MTENKSFVVNELWAFAKKHPILLSTNMMLSLTFPIDDVFVPFLIGIIVTRVEERGDWITPLIYLVIILIGMQVVYTLTYWEDAMLIPKLQNFIKHRMIETYVNGYDGRSLDFNSGEIMSRIVKIPLILTDLYANVKNYILPYILSFTITSIIIYNYHKKLGVIIFICAFLIFAIILASPTLCNSASRKQEQAQAHMDEEIDDMLLNLQVIYASNMKECELHRLKGFAEKYRAAFANTYTCVMKGRALTTLVLAIMMISFVILSKKGLGSKTLTTGKFVTIFTILLQWFGTLGWMTGMMRELIIQWGILSSFKKPVFVAHEPPTIPLPGHRTAFIEVVDLTYIPSQKIILDEFNVSIGQGERVAIMGDIGSGKSTLLKIMNGVYTPTSGEIYIDGQPLSKIPKSELRSVVGYVPQNPVLFNRSIMENIQYGCNNADAETIMRLLKELGLDDTFVDLNKRVGKGGMYLSGGQRQLIAVMRVVLDDPPVLIMDEITSSLDASTKVKLFHLLQKLFQNKTVVMVTHDPDILGLATRTIKMKSVS